MYGNSEIISYLQTNKILALKLDHSIYAVGKRVADHVDALDKGVTRLLYYTSCFTDEYNDVCQQQKIQDTRFRHAITRLIRHGDIIYDMFKIYFEEIFKHKTYDQLEKIKKLLMAANVHISASALTGAGYALALATSVRRGFNLSIKLSSLAGRVGGTAVTFVGFYGVVQKAADSAHFLQIRYPAYYMALYMQELEMLYFLIEPMLERAGALKAPGASDYDIVNIITRMIR